MEGKQEQPATNVQQDPNVIGDSSNVMSMFSKLMKECWQHDHNIRQSFVEVIKRLGDIIDIYNKGNTSTVTSSGSEVRVEVLEIQETTLKQTK